MEVLEGRAEWGERVWRPWFEHYERTGTVDWKLYRPPRNSEIPGTHAIDLSQSRLMLISSTGAYLRESQTPFDPETKVGDYSIGNRTFVRNWESLVWTQEGHRRLYRTSYVGLVATCCPVSGRVR